MVIGDVDDIASRSKKLCRGLGTSEIDRGLSTSEVVDPGVKAEADMKCQLCEKLLKRNLSPLLRRHPNTPLLSLCVKCRGGQWFKTISAVLGIDRDPPAPPSSDAPRATTSEGDCISSSDKSTELLQPSSSEGGAAVEANAEGKGEMKLSSTGGGAAVEAKAEGKGEMKPSSTRKRAAVEAKAKWKAEMKLRREQVEANKACSFDEWMVILRSQYSTKNTKNFAEFGPRYMSSATILWECSNCRCGQKHEWKSPMASRVGKRSGCPFCAGGTQKVCRCRSLATLYPDLMKQWDKAKNEEIDLFNISSRSNKIVWWICDKTCPNGCVHSWSGAVVDRIKSGCPYCSKPPLKICRCSSFAIKRPDLHLEWDVEKNIGLDPYSFAPGSRKFIWWKCCNFNCEFKCVHSWQTTINQRARKKGSGCPYCSKNGSKYCEHNSLLGKFPQLIAEEWDNKANELLGLHPQKMAPHANIQAHWKCRQNHQWTAYVSARTAEFGSGCPYCPKPSHGERRLYEVAKEMGLKCEKRSLKATNVTTGFRMTLRMDMWLLYWHACIEFDGRQHFESGYLGDLASSIIRDRSKNLACRKQGIHLLRISYLEIGKIDFWMAKFVKAIREFKPRTITTKSGKVWTQRTVNMCSNADLYNAQAEFIV